MEFESGNSNQWDGLYMNCLVHAVLFYDSFQAASFQAKLLTEILIKDKGKMKPMLLDALAFSCPSQSVSDLKLSNMLQKEYL